MEGLHGGSDSELVTPEGGEVDELRPVENPGKTKRKKDRGFFRVWRVLIWPIALVLVLLFGGYFAIESGYLDKPLKTVAFRLLNQIAGDDFDIQLEKTVLRFGSRGGLVLEARDVSLSDKATSLPLFRTDKVRIRLDIENAFGAGVSADEIDLSGVSLDFQAFQHDSQAALRVDVIPKAMEQVFAALSHVSEELGSAGAKRISLSDLRLVLPALQERTAALIIEKVELTGDGDGDFSLAGAFSMDGKKGSIAGAALKGEGGINAVHLSIEELNVSPFLSKWTREGAPNLGLYGTANLTLDVTRAGPDSPQPELTLLLTLPDAAFYGGGVAAQINKGELRAHYDFAADKIEVEKSIIEFPGARLPFSGGIIDGDRLDRKGIDHIGVELVIDQAISRTASMQERPQNFSGKILADFDPEKLILKSDNLFVTTASGLLGGSLSIDFGKEYDPRFDGDSPEISLALYSDRISTSAFKQLWPFWLGDKAREWAGDNLFAGSLRDLSISLYLPSGRLPVYPEPVFLEKNELQIDFSMRRGRINIAGDIPPLRDTVGKFHLEGRRLEVSIESGSAYFPSGRVVELKGGTLTLGDIYQPQLDTETDMKIAGPADAVGELATYRPIQALERIGFKPEDFSGYVTATLAAHFPLNVDEAGATEASWKAQLALDNVSISKPIGGKTISAVNGQLAIDPESAALDASVAVDGVPLQISMVEPLVKDVDIKRRRTLSGTLDGPALAKLVPGLEDVVDGNVRMQVELQDEARQTVKADLTDAAVTIPWAGWTKGPGIPAKISFDTTKNGDRFDISKFNFSGDGFGATGELSTGDKGLTAIKFSRVKLAPGDAFSFSLRRSAHGYIINVKGKSADLRGVLYKVKSDGAGSGGKTPDVKVTAQLEKAIGFNNEIMQNVDFDFETVGGEPALLKLNAVSGGGQAVVVSTQKDEANRRTIEITTSDAGALARFTGLYTYMYGGLLNQKVRYLGKGEWTGSVDIRRFDLLNEKRFEDLVSTRSGKDGKSLNEAVHKNIDLQAQHFSRGNAQLSIKDGVFSVSRGVVRGEQVGATFQGIVRDKNGNMNMTGTFMPAYGLNRLFAELPLIGIILGNGRDKGLIGITFRLAGPISKPKLQINPLSIIAPGVFRGIFEFQ